MTGCATQRSARRAVLKVPPSTERRVHVLGAPFVVLHIHIREQVSTWQALVFSPRTAKVQGPHAQTSDHIEPTALDFQNSSGLPRSPRRRILKFEREDWTCFRTIEGLAAEGRRGTDKLRRLVLKEITDNALDNGTRCPHR